ncbi:MAG: hypothetical protein PWQ87_679 [Candidatus Woesearchaeota archaeon]|nr:hypothetical protein [Candidatus Woesearchaeota archaeon]
MYWRINYLFMKLTIILEEQEEGGYTAYVPSLKGCISEGNTKEEAIKNIKEAIELYLEAETNDLIEFSGEKVVVSV